MINNEPRVIMAEGILDTSELYAGYENIYLTRNIYDITRSKLTTNYLIDGKPDFDIVDNYTEDNEKGFVTTIIPLCFINFTFESVPHGVDRIYRTKLITVGPGDLLMYHGTTFSEAKTFDGTICKPDINFKEIRYNKIDRVPHGNGSKKYKASITFSDTYEIELFADTEEDAKKMSQEIPITEWDHIFNIDKSRWSEYKTQKTRHSNWLPDDIKITNLGE